MCLNYVDCNDIVGEIQHIYGDVNVDIQPAPTILSYTATNALQSEEVRWVQSASSHRQRRRDPACRCSLPLANRTASDATCGSATEAVSASSPEGGYCQQEPARPAPHHQERHGQRGPAQPPPNGKSPRNVLFGETQFYHCIICND